MAWFNVFLIGIFCIVPAKLLAPIAVLFVDRKNHPIWGVRDATDLGYWNTGFRNSAHNLLNKPAVRFTQNGNDLAKRDWSLETLPGFQWRTRKSVDGKYVSLRITWGEPRPSKGKREFYIGWTMNKTPTFGLSFVQFRPF